MSVDLSILVKNDVYETDSLEACREYILEAIAGLKRYFLGDDIIEDLRLDEEDELNFYLKPLGHVRVYLHKGCWEFETCYSYARYFLKDENNRNWLRRFAFDCARVFGQSEAWITDEHHGWFGVLGSVSDGFDDWLHSGSLQEGWPDDVLKYNPDDFPNVNRWNYNYGPKYHDTFDEPKRRLEELSATFRGYEILTISPSAAVILGRKGGRLHALDISKNKLFVDYPIDGINANFNSVAIEIYKNGESALFNFDGEQLTPFGTHDFSWSWEKANKVVKVTDELTGKNWLFDI